MNGEKIMINYKKIAWGGWLIASIFYAYQYVLRVMPNIMLNDIMQQFNIDAVVFGQFSGSYYIGYSLLHIPMGLMLDRYGPKKIMSISILLIVAGLLPLLFLENYIYSIIGRFLTGVGSSAAILGTFKIIRLTFPEKYFTRMLSLSVTIGLIGAIYGGGPVSYLSKVYGYKSVISMMAIIGVIFSIITYICVPETSSKSEASVFSTFKAVFSNAKVLITCFLAGLMVGPLEGFADAWGSEFLKQVYNFDAIAANYTTSIIYTGMFFAPVLSYIGEKTGRYMETIAGAGFIMLIFFTLLVMNLLNYNSIMIGFFIVGICCAYQILAIYKASTYVNENAAGLTTAVANMIIMSFGYVFHSVIGVIVGSCTTTTKSLAFTYGVSVIPITLLIGSIGFLMMAYQEKAKTSRK